ncbi:MAG: hypothetical protein HYX35_06160 [Proteobacteria bacterium]|nr:hypothetical protein [Pseudomonadota bacterium]
MRILSPYAPDAGYEPGFVELNHEEGHLEITHPSLCVLLEGSQIVPETLALRCVLHPVSLLNKTSKVQSIFEGEALAETFLYDESSVSQGDARNSQWSGIAVEYVGVGQGIYQGEKFVFSGKTLPFGTMEEQAPLYLKPFCVETQSYQVRTTTLAGGQTLTSPPGVLNTRVLRGYGGCYQPGIPLEQIQQVYYALTSDYDKTRIRLYTSSALQAQHTPPPHGGRDFNQEVMFSPLPREEEYLSLSGALAAGYARFSLKTDYGVVQYSSYLCESVPGHPTFVSVSFRP